jgi:hypothetical protein
VGKPPKRQQISGIHEPKPEFFEPVTKKAAHLGLRKKKNRFVQRFLKDHHIFRPVDSYLPASGLDPFGDG